MDPQTLTAQQIAPFLAPLLPYLLKGGKLAAQEAAKKLGEQFGKQTFDFAQALWEKLRGKQNVAQVAQAAAALPDNQALREALREEIARALQEDPALREEVTRLMQSEVVQRVLAESKSQIYDVRQEAEGGPAHQEVRARGDSVVKGVRQIHKRK